MTALVGVAGTRCRASVLPRFGLGSRAGRHAMSLRHIRDVFAIPYTQDGHDVPSHEMFFKLNAQVSSKKTKCGRASWVVRILV